MKPHISIRKVCEHYYDYGVRLGHGEERYVGRGLCSLAECLHDAATALGSAFLWVDLSYGDVALGTYSVPTLEHDTVLLSRRLLNRLVTKESAVMAEFEHQALRSGLKSDSPPSRCRHPHWRDVASPVHQ